jgi:hypothetical protein
VSETLIDGRLTTVIVARTAFEAASNPEKADQLTAAIVSFVNDVQQAGVYARHELPAKALQVPTITWPRSTLAGIANSSTTATRC